MKDRRLLLIYSRAVQSYSIKIKLTFGLPNSRMNQFPKLVKKCSIFMHLGRTLEVASLAHAQYCHDLSRKVEFFAKQGSAIKNWCVGKNLIKHLSVNERNFSEMSEI